MPKILIFIILYSLVFAAAAGAQEKPPETKANQTAPKTLKKTNSRPVAAPPKPAPADPFDKATVAAMAAQCVKFETGAGDIEMEMFPESAPESVRSFLNLAATGFFDTTTFSRVVPGFIIQGGNLASREKSTPEFDKRAWRTVPDEPSLIKHERGTLSMARTEAPNSAKTDFFILVADAHHLDGTFAAFGRVTRGMEVVDAVNKMPVEGDKPTKPVRIRHAVVSPCAAQAKP